MPRSIPVSGVFNIFKRCLQTFCLPTILAPVASAEEVTSDPVFCHFPDRCNEQFQTSPGYALCPFLYCLPYVGEDMSSIGASMNTKYSDIDTYDLIVTSDGEGFATGVADTHILPRTVILIVGYSTLSKVVIQSYSERSMGTEKDDYRLVEFNNTKYYVGRVTTTFFNRRFELYGHGTSMLLS